MQTDHSEYEQAKGRIDRQGQNPNVITHVMNEDEMQNRITARLANKSSITAAALAMSRTKPFPESDKPVQVVAARASSGSSELLSADFNEVERRVMYGQSLSQLRSAAEEAANAVRRFSASLTFDSAILEASRFATLIKEWKMEDKTQNVWTQVPKRKRRFHLNAEKRAATNWAGTMKMLRLLAPCGVQANAQALDVINAKYGI